MKVCLLACLAIAGATLLSQTVPNQDDDEPEPKALDRLVLDLGSDIFQNREDAMRRLRKLGDLAIPYLRKHKDDADLELRRRAADLISELEGRKGQVLCLTGHEEGVIALALLPGDRQALSASEDRTIRLWDLAEGKLLRSFEGHTKQIWALAITSDGKSFFSSGQDRQIRQWDVGGDRSIELATLPDSVRCLMVSGDGKLLFAGSLDAKIYVIDIAAHKVVDTWTGQKDGVLCLALSPDGRTMVSGGAYHDQSICVRDAKTGAVHQRLLGHVQHVCAVAFVDNDHVISAGYDQVIRLWDLRTGKVEHTFQGHAERIYGLAVSRDGKRLLSGAYDRLVILWDLEKHMEMRRYHRHEGGVNVLAFAGDGRHALSGGDDRTIRVWELPRILKKR